MSQCTFPGLLLVLGGLLAGCASPQSQEQPSVSKAWQERSSSGVPASEPRHTEKRDPGETNSHSAVSARPPSTPLSQTAAAEVGATIAIVNGKAIPTSRLTSLLVRSHGAGLLEQLVVHDAAEQLAAQRNLSITQADIDREYDSTLRQLVDPARLSESEEFDRPRAEQLLASILAERNISHDEFMVGMSRNACLRKIVNAEHSISEADLQIELERISGERAQVRNIQVATLSAVSSVQQALARGEDFSELATRYSAAAGSAKAGGRMAPFSRSDDLVPIPLRDAAFALQPGEVSQPIRIGEWFHIVKLDAILPARKLELAEVRGDLERRIRDRLAPKAMEELYDRLLQNARIEIDDPILRAEFKERVRARAR